jgi:hypothetical protein
MLTEPAYGGDAAITEEIFKAYEAGVLNNPDLNGTTGRSVVSLAHQPPPTVP